MSHQDEHCVVDSNTQEFHCKNCGGRESPKLPMPILEYVRATKKFTNKHHDCKPKVKP